MTVTRGGAPRTGHRRTRSAGKQVAHVVVPESMERTSTLSELSRSSAAPASADPGPLFSPRGGATQLDRAGIGTPREATTELIEGD
jgi:hypothetical protein